MIKGNTYLGFTNVILIFLRLKKKLMKRKAIMNFKPDILFTVDSPDFTLRVAERVKKVIQR